MFAFVLSWWMLGRCCPPAVMETRPAVQAELTFIPFNPPVATYIRLGKVPYRVN